MKSLIQKIYKPMNNLKIANKMMFIYVVGGFIPLLLLSFYLTGYTRGILIDQATQEALTNASRMEERLQDFFRVTISVSDGIYLDDQLKELINTQYDTKLDVINDLQEYTKMDDYLRLYQELDSIRIYVENDTLLDNSQIIPVMDVHREADWYQLSVANDGKVAFGYRYDEITRNNHLSLYRLIKDEHGNKLGVLVVNINNNTLRNLIESEPYQIVGIIDNSQIFLSSDIEYEGLLEDSDEIKALNELPDTLNQFSIAESTFKVTADEFMTHSSGNLIRLLTVIPIENFVGFANDSIVKSIILISLSVLLAFLMVYFLTRTLSDKIDEFRKQLHRVATGDFEIDYHVGDLDEIGMLFSDLEVMSNSLKELIQKVYEAGIQKEQLTARQREVEFKMLTSQIDPHFLYNTLETIRMEAIINDQTEIAQIVKKLAFIMRRKLSISSGEVSLESELELLSHYLEIQQFRFRERVTYSIKRLCDTKHFKILPLLLQPIVENAFIHGLEKKVGHGDIEITVNESEDFLEITIEDNGIGIDEISLEKLKAKMDMDMLTFDGSIGLANVYQRIQIFYQPPYRLEVESKEEKGTLVKFFLPKRGMRTQEEGSDV